jgi:hypothetical protein
VDGWDCSLSVTSLRGAARSDSVARCLCLVVRPFGTVKQGEYYILTNCEIGSILVIRL